MVKIIYNIQVFEYVCELKSKSVMLYDTVRSDFDMRGVDWNRVKHDSVLNRIK